MNNKKIDRIISEVIRKELKTILSEDKERDGMKSAIKYIISKGYSKENAEEIFNTLRNDIPSIRLPLYTNSNGREKGTYKFAIGVARMYINGELNDGSVISQLNVTLKLLAQAHANEYDNNLNNMSAQDLNQRFAAVKARNLQNDMNDVASENYTPNGYSVVRIADAKTAKRYGKYTSWCVTHYKDMYDAYTGDGLGLFYFFLKDGFEKIKQVEGENCPLDEYGLSMIAVSVNMDGSLNTVTCRWNHDNGGNDNILDAKALSKIVGMNVYEVCKPYTREELHAKGVILFDEVQELLDNGKKPKEIFEDVGPFYDGYAWVELNNKCNFIDTKGNVLSRIWFDYVGKFRNGYVKVELNNKCNFIDTKGNMLSHTWFNYVDEFHNGYAKVELNKKYNLIDTKGNMLSHTWFDGAGSFYDGYACIKLNNKWNFIDAKGNMLSHTWFNSTGSFSDGYAWIRLNDKYNFIDTKGNILLNTWFDNNGSFHNGYAWVELNDKYNFIDTKGNILSRIWFDYVSEFYGDYACVKLNNKCNFIDTKGNILLNTWFDGAGSFYDGYAWIKLNNKYNFIDPKGNLLSHIWFDSATDFMDGYAWVELNGKEKFIDTKGNISSRRSRID